MVLTYAICVQVKTTKSINLSVASTYSDNELRSQVLKWKEKYDNKYEEYQDTEKELTKIREQSAKDNDTYSKKEQEIKLNNTILGLTEVKGSGVEIVIKDNQEVKVDKISTLDSIEYYLVHAQDLRSIINELKNAGAEAISINDQRIVSTTSITCEGNVIKINGEKIGSPFVIKAIGSPELLYGLSRPGGYLELLNDTGVLTEITKKESITIKKYQGVMNFKYARLYK